MAEFCRLYEQQYSVALFNKVRYDVEGGGGPQPQLLHRKVPLENRCIFSGLLFQYLEENKKWRNRFLFIPDSYSINYYDSKASHDRGLQPKGTISCAGYKVLTSMEQYLELVANSLPGVKAKVGSSPFLKVATQFPLILWHPYGRHLYFCVVTEKDQLKWLAVFQDCVRHANDGLSEESTVQTPAFTDSVRLYRQARGQYGTWDMMCGGPPQILSNLVMEVLVPEVRDLISPRLKGKLQERQRTWMLISDAVYSLVQRQCEAQFQAVEQSCETGRPLLEASIRTDMDQIITSKEHVTNKIRVFFQELVDMNKNAVNQGTKETVAEHMEKISMLAFHPVKMQSCYELVEHLSLDGLQQRFDVSSPSVFVQRAQILMREILHQSLESQGTEGLCKTIQRCQDRVIKKFDYDSSTVRKRFFREALLQIFIPYMLKQLTPACSSDLPGFQELIFEDFSRFILVDRIFEEVVLHSVMKDIMTAVKEAAVQRRHNLYRDSIVMTSSDPNLHLLGDKPSIDWAGEYGTPGAEEEETTPQQEAGGPDAADGGGEGAGAQKKRRRRRMKQVVSMIQVEGSPTLPNEPCMDVPGVDGIPEEEEEEEEDDDDEEDEEEEEKEKEKVDEKKKDDGVPTEDRTSNSGCNGIAGSPTSPDSPPDVLTNGSPSKEPGSEEVSPEEEPLAGAEDRPSADPPKSIEAPPPTAGSPVEEKEEKEEEEKEEEAEVGPNDNTTQKPVAEVVTETAETAPATRETPDGSGETLPPPPVTAAPDRVQDSPSSSPKPTAPEDTPPAMDPEPATTHVPPPTPPADGEEAEEAVAPPEGPDTSSSSSPSPSSPPPPPTSEEEKGAAAPESPRQQQETEPTLPVSDSQSAEEDSPGPCSQ
ncbi:hypothetical protein NHX12_028781 [Muraenolepis orangiensis]|uniref:PH domain-containing protein n=1 Tax=Muraenolepis orangiensis TaxID=630683 RepID=A0A9Q0EEP1_9TELE|nr:hypothetical protein NHX12_028781 [Muraenolepis orangiensis]